MGETRAEIERATAWVLFETILTDSFEEPGKEIADGDTLLLHRVAVTDGDGVFQVFFSFFEANRFEIDGDAEWRSDFILTTIATADGGGLVVENVHEGLEEVLHFLGLFHELGLILQERKNGSLDRSDARLEAHYRADVLLAAFFCEVFFVEGFTNQGQDGSVAAGGGFDNVRDKLLLGLLVEVFERLAGVFLVLAEVVVATIRDTFQFLLAEGEVVFNVVSFLRVMGSLAIGNVEDVELLFIESDLVVKRESLFEPFVGEAEAIFGAAEIFNFHLLELTRAEGEVTRVDFVAEGFTDLRDSKGKLHAVGVHHVFVLHKNGLRGLRTEVSGRVGIIVIGRGPHLRFKHEFKVAGLGEEGAIFRIEIRDVSFLGSGFSKEGEFFWRDLLVVEELRVKFFSGLPGLVFILVRFVQEHGVGAIG